MDKRAFYVLNTAGKKVESKKVNIDGGDDMFYRYKMSQLQIQVVGKGKMIKTMVLNTEEVASDLHLMPQYIPAYLGYEIGAQFKYEAKKPERERASISGDYTAKELSNVISKMVKEVVQCPNCTLPELKMKCDAKKRAIYISCASCGFSGELKKGSQKFHKYILNNPPKNLGGVENKKLKQVQVRKEKEKAEKKATPERPQTPDKNEKDSASGSDKEQEHEGQDIEFDEEDIIRTEKDLERVKKDGVNWQTDTSEEAMKNRQNLLVPDAIKDLVAAGIDNSGLDTLNELLEKTPSDADVISSLSSLKAKRSIEDDEAVDAIFTYLYGTCEDLKSILKNTKTHTKLLQALLKEESSQVIFLLKLEDYILKNSSFISKTASILKKCFYDTDLVTEEAIFKWDAKPADDQRVRAKAQPMIEWLKNAEEESD